ncbi:hypothetical protein EVAR_91044_1 [Eumeta japonica]|uniref:Uncharacterized protein n=1 Tax=Eumeta variegata TaxID=151549 RepID=A0A4C1Z3M1_EUMVA|nr:hypothetical protein EVAR_91044_1 [Eumeta japonica]
MPYITVGAAMPLVALAQVHRRPPNRGAILKIAHSMHYSSRARGRPIIVEWERDASIRRASLVRIKKGNDRKASKCIIHSFAMVVIVFSRNQLHQRHVSRRRRMGERESGVPRTVTNNFNPISSTGPLISMISDPIRTVCASSLEPSRIGRRASSTLWIVQINCHTGRSNTSV